MLCTMAPGAIGDFAEAETVVTAKAQGKTVVNPIGAAPAPRLDSDSELPITAPQPRIVPDPDKLLQVVLVLPGPV
jgi:hypothetical protein